jgi:hypothetical protein
MAIIKNVESKEQLKDPQPLVLVQSYYAESLSRDWTSLTAAQLLAP